MTESAIVASYSDATLAGIARDLGKSRAWMSRLWAVRAEIEKRRCEK